MTRLDLGPVVLFAEPDGNLGVLIYTPGNDDDSNWSAWDTAVAEAAKMGLLNMSDEPDIEAGGSKIFLITR